ncbi:MAG: hypothetical protein K2Q18_12430, partial [Bdellovibrionales bacterium]|nr:hypothetical protein [Bdellovibrionales bacterium]
VMASENNYQCIADKMQAINSDIWYNLSKEEIDTILSIPEYVGHTEAVMARKACREEVSIDRAYKCVAAGLEAINSDLYYNLSKYNIDTMLSIPEYAGHVDAVIVARSCKLRF